MKKIAAWTLIWMVSLSLYECKLIERFKTGEPDTVTASIETEGLLSCCPANLKMPDGKPVWCEASAVLYENGTVYVANDKDMPSGYSSVFTKPWKSFSDSAVRPTPLLAKAFIDGKKYEDFAVNSHYVFLTTAFDRVKPDSPEWDGYNTILYWKKGNEAKPQVLAPESNAKSSVAYRKQLSALLGKNSATFPNGMPYFKIEGIAALDTVLLFGIREEGESYSKFDYRVRIISVPFFVEKSAAGERIVLKDNWRLVADFDPATVAGLPKPLALSSLEYDPLHKRFWMLTSIESNGELDAYLWTATPKELFDGKTFKIVQNPQGQFVHFGHKAEDLTVIDHKHLLVIHDDDRNNTKVGDQIRQPHQAAYTVLKLQ